MEDRIAAYFQNMQISRNMHNPIAKDREELYKIPKKFIQTEEPTERPLLAKK
jgi:hypothetical protein